MAGGGNEGGIGDSLSPIVQEEEEEKGAGREEGKPEQEEETRVE